MPGTNAGTTIGASIGANLLITITPDLNPKTILKVNNFKITSQNYLQLGQLIFVDSLSPITFQASVYNEGNHITETKGTVTITKKQETLSVQGLLPQYVLSKNSRQLLNQNGSHIFIFKPNLLSFGRHQINIHVKSDSTNTQNSQDLIVVPIKIALGLLLLFFLLKFILKKNPKIVDIDS